MKNNWEEPQKELLENIFKQRAEVLDNFCSAFLVQKFDSYEDVDPEMFTLITTQKTDGMQLITTHELVFIDHEERERLKEKIVAQEAYERDREEGLADELKTQINRQGFITDEQMEEIYERGKREALEEVHKWLLLSVNGYADDFEDDVVIPFEVKFLTEFNCAEDYLTMRAKAKSALIGNVAKAASHAQKSKLTLTK